MMKRLAWIPALMLAMLLMSGACGDDDENRASPSPSAAPTEEPWEPVTITDDLGAEVTLDEKPAAIVALAPSFAEVLFALGEGDSLVGVDENSDYPAEVAELPKVSGFEPSVEEITALEPDLVLLTFDPGGLQASLSEVDVPSLMFANPVDFEGVYTQIETLGTVVGANDEAEAITAQMQKDLDGIVSQLEGEDEGPSFFHEIDNTLFTIGPGSFQHEAYALLKARNIAEETGEAFPKMSNEAVIAADPEVITLADAEFGESAETVAARPGWDAISAVVNGRVVPVNDDLLSRPGPRVVDGVMELASILYPEIFGQ
jgi:iron complex transport system substrate-binding protein